MMNRKKFSCVIGLLVIFLALFVICVTVISRVDSSTVPKKTEYKLNKYEIGSSRISSNIISLPHKLQKNYFLFHHDGGSISIISSTESAKYECSGTCTCREFEENRRVASVIPSTITFFVAAVSTTMALKISRLLAEKQCKTLFPFSNGKKCSRMESSMDDCFTEGDSEWVFKPHGENEEEEEEEYEMDEHKPLGDSEWVYKPHGKEEDHHEMDEYKPLSEEERFLQGDFEEGFEFGDFEDPNLDEIDLNDYEAVGPDDNAEDWDFEREIAKYEARKKEVKMAENDFKEWKNCKGYCLNINTEEGFANYRVKTYFHEKGDSVMARVNCEEYSIKDAAESEKDFMFYVLNPYCQNLGFPLYPNSADPVTKDDKVYPCSGLYVGIERGMKPTDDYANVECRRMEAETDFGI